jgi:RNA polymerase sigma factor (sigma-70 family)
MQHFTINLVSFFKRGILETEKALVSKILGGNLNAFKDLVEMYQKLVVHLVFRHISRQEHREEICQEVFIKVFQNLSGFKFQSKLSTWIGKIAYTTTINYLRKEKIHGSDDIRTSSNNDENEDKYYDTLDAIHSDDLSPSETVERQDISKLIHKNIGHLPTPYQTIITLYHLEQMSYQEISEIMDLPEGTVKSYLFRGRKKLKDSLVKELQGEEVL